MITFFDFITFSQDEELIKAFNNNQDIHTKVAADIFDIDENMVTKNQRRTAKAVIFGIVYGISGFGLGENLELSAKDAKKYIDKYTIYIYIICLFLQSITIYILEKTNAKII